jgi:hypothetical protein
MGTQCIVAVKDGNRFRGRYVHWDGNPSGVGLFLHELLARDGLRAVIQTIVVDHPTGWSALSPRSTEADSRPGSDDRPGFVFVPGYGVAYEDVPEQHQWLSPTDDVDAEWAYVLTRRGIVVWQNEESWFKRRDIDLRLTGEQLDILSQREPGRQFFWWCVARYWYWSGRIR